MDDDFYDPDDDYGGDFDEFESEDTPIKDDLENEDEPSKDGFSFEDAMFWGGYLGMNIDEEREDRRRRKKLEIETSKSDDVFRLDDTEED